jgi:hypothetical protein
MSRNKSLDVDVDADVMSARENSNRFSRWKYSAVHHVIKLLFSTISA